MSDKNSFDPGIHKDYFSNFYDDAPIAPMPPRADPPKENFSDRLSGWMADRIPILRESNTVNTEVISDSSEDLDFLLPDEEDLYAGTYGLERTEIGSRRQAERRTKEKKRNIAVGVTALSLGATVVAGMVFINSDSETSSPDTLDSTLVVENSGSENTEDPNVIVIENGDSSAGSSDETDFVTHELSTKQPIIISIDKPLYKKTKTQGNSEKSYFPEQSVSSIDNTEACITEDVMIPSSISAEAENLASLFTPALSHEDYDELSSKLENAASVAEVQRIVRKAFGDAGFESSKTKDGGKGVQYIDQYPGVGLFGLPGFDTEGFKPPVEDLSNYKEYMITNMSALRYLPAEMFQSVDVIAFSNSQYLGQEGAIAVYSTGGTIYISGESNNVRSMIHELAHAVHEKACHAGLHNDQEYEVAYDTARALIVKNPVPFKDSLGPFPTTYSTSHYSELFAELTTELILNGIRTEEDLSSLTEEQRGVVIKLQELTVERLQVALPETNVTAWLSLHRLYDAESHNLITSETGKLQIDYGDDYLVHSAIEKEDIPLADGGPINREELARAERVPVVIVNFSDGNTETIYARVLPDGRQIVMFNEAKSSEINDAVSEYFAQTSQPDSSNHIFYVWGKDDQGVSDIANHEKGLFNKKRPADTVTVRIQSA